MTVKKPRGTFEERFWAKVDKRAPDECWPWIGSFLRHGYGQISRGGAANGMTTAHRASYEIHNGPIPEGPGFHGFCVCHRCDNKWCVNPNHLFLGTIQENHNDMIFKGRQAKTDRTKHLGESHGMAKLNRAAVQAIRDDLSLTTASAAKKFNISKDQVRRIRNGTSWKFFNNEEYKQCQV